MKGRRRLFAIVLLAAALHSIGIARTILPAQDGLKFIRIAREFQARPATDVIRGNDQHPLYPALVAMAEPIVAACLGHGPDTWRIAAQSVAALASVVLLVPLHGLARALFDDGIAAMAALLFVLLPIPSEVGHDTLSDSLGLLATLLALGLGARAMATGDRRAFVGCGLAAGLGYLARPEVALVPLAVGITLVAGDRRPAVLRLAAVRLSTLGVVFLTMVGGYALVKGEVSEKLALRHGTGLVQRPAPVRKSPRWLPPGLDDARWNFAPKEESAVEPPATTRAAVEQLIVRWAEGLGGFFGLFAIWGAVRARQVRTLIGRGPTDEDPDGSGPPSKLRLLMTVYLVLFALVLVRHVVMLGYLSDRHLLPMVAVALPWAAAGTYVCSRGIAVKLGWTSGRSRRVGVALLAVGIMAAVVLPQMKPGHRSRWGHRAAGQWLREHARPSDAVLDTRGWAAFVSNRPSYDYWHVRQALTDAHLAYVVVGDDELSAGSRRAATLRAILAYSAIPVAEFPDDEGGRGVGVRVFAYHRPDSWEGLRP
jgi:Dolichyl-phosphate-mannose-protein mannosyltransferase